MCQAWGKAICSTVDDISKLPESSEMIIFFNCTNVLPTGKFGGGADTKHSCIPPHTRGHSVVSSHVRSGALYPLCLLVRF